MPHVALERGGPIGKLRFEAVHKLPLHFHDVICLTRWARRTVHQP